jgi:hypothetical protein
MADMSANQRFDPDTEAKILKAAEPVLKAAQRARAKVLANQALTDPVLVQPPNPKDSMLEMLLANEKRWIGKQRWQVDPEPPPDPTIPQAGPDDDWVQMVDR